jgi:PST family polysaccharide transporter
MAIRQVLSVFSQVIYPHICKLTKESHIEIVRFYIKFYVPFFVFIILSCISVFVFSEEITSFFTNQNVITISNLIKILCFAPIVTCLNIPFDRTLLAYKLEKDYSIIITLGSIFSIVLCFLFSYLFQATGTAIAILLTETFITLGLLIMLELKHKHISLIFRR